MSRNHRCGRAGAASTALAASALLLAAPAAEAEGTGLIFVSNEKSDTITVLDGATDTVLRTIETCGRPRDMEWNEDKTRIYVACADTRVPG